MLEPENPMQPVLDKFQSGVDVLLFAYMAESGLALSEIEKITIQRDKAICVHLEPKKK